MSGFGRAAIGSLIGAALAGAIAPLLRPLLSPPTGGVGVLTIAGYPKGWDYAVVALLVLGAFVGALLLVAGSQLPVASREKPQATGNRRLATAATAATVFLLMLVIHDHPFTHMDPFHEGEHLTPAFLFLDGQRPYDEVFLLHGLGVDGGLDALVGARPVYTRRLRTVLDAATLALLVPIAVEVTVTTGGMVAAVIASLCGVAALWVPVFPYFRLAPVLLAAIGLLRYARTGRAAPLFLAFLSSTLGLLWSLDTGTYALAGTIVVLVFLWSGGHFRPPAVIGAQRIAWLAIAAFVIPIIILIMLGTSGPRFFEDSFVIIPRAIDAVWSLPAPEPLTAAGARYYLPLVLYGFLLAIGWKRRDARILIVVILSILLFRTAVGRVSWSHTRYATPLLGIAFVAFVIEPLRNRIAIALLALAAFFCFEVPQNVAAGAKFIAKWPSRQRPEAGLVRNPLARDIYTTEQNAIDLATLKGYVDSLGEGTILDFTNERALYFLLRRKPPVRCFDIPMLSAPPLLSEAMRELEEEPPVCVILGGDPNVAVFDGVPNHVRVPELARWIDERYPRRTQIGRFVVASK